MGRRKGTRVPRGCPYCQEKLVKGEILCQDCHHLLEGARANIEGSVGEAGSREPGDGIQAFTENLKLARENDRVSAGSSREEQLDPGHSYIPGVTARAAEGAREVNARVMENRKKMKNHDTRPEDRGSKEGRGTHRQGHERGAAEGGAGESPGGLSPEEKEGLGPGLEGEKNRQPQVARSLQLISVSPGYNRDMYPRASLARRLLAYLVDSFIQVAPLAPGLLVLYFSNVNPLYLVPGLVGRFLPGLAEAYSQGLGGTQGTAPGGLGHDLGLGLLLAGALWALVFGLTRDGWGQGQSPGKKIMGLMVVSLKDHRPCSWSRSLVRRLTLPVFWLLPLLGWFIEPITVLRQKKGRRVGDLLAQTQVIHRSQSRPIS